MSFLLLLTLHAVTFAQVYGNFGFQQSFVRNDVLNGASPYYSMHTKWGVKMVIKGTDDKLFFSPESGIIEKGYTQTLGGEKFRRTFLYWQLSPVIGYVLSPDVSVKAGLDWALLVNVNAKRYYETYQPQDLALTAGLTFFDRKVIGLYFQAAYGMIPVLEYQDIDAMGNFNGNIRDIKHTTFMIGFRLNISHGKIYL